MKRRTFYCFYNKILYTYKNICIIKKVSVDLEKVYISFTAFTVFTKNTKMKLLASSFVLAMILMMAIMHTTTAQAIVHGDAVPKEKSKDKVRIISISILITIVLHCQIFHTIYLYITITSDFQINDHNYIATFVL